MKEKKMVYQTSKVSKTRCPICNKSFGLILINGNLICTICNNNLDKAGMI